MYLVADELPDREDVPAGGYVRVGDALYAAGIHGFRRLDRVPPRFAADFPPVEAAEDDDDLEGRRATAATEALLEAGLTDPALAFAAAAGEPAPPGLSTYARRAYDAAAARAAEIGK